MPKPDPKKHPTRYFTNDAGDRIEWYREGNSHTFRHGNAGGMQFARSLKEANDVLVEIQSEYDDPSWREVDDTATVG